MIKFDATKPKVKVTRPGRPTYAVESTTETVDQGSTTALTDRDADVLRSTASTVKTEGEIIADLEHLVTFESLDTGIATAGAEGKISHVSNGTARILCRNVWDRQRFDVAVSETGGQSVDEFVSWVAGSLAKHATDKIEDAISGLTPSASTLDMFSTVDHDAPSYTRNASQWCAAFQQGLTACNAWQSGGWGGGGRAHTAITKRHIVGASHYADPAPIGTTVRFVATDGTVVDRTITHTRKIPGTDIQTSLLDSDLPASITPVSILPTNWENYLPHHNPDEEDFGLPCILRNQFGEARIFDLRFIKEESAGPTGYTNPSRASYRAEIMPASRADWQRDLVGGDSGGPSMMIVGTTLVLVNTWTGSSSGAAYHDHNWATEIAALDTLASIATGYTPSIIDLSGFTSFA